MDMILLVDDCVDELRHIRFHLDKAGLKDAFIYWVRDLESAKELISTKIYEFNLVLIDVSGTTFGDFSKEVSEIIDQNIVLCSAVLIPIDTQNKNKFVLKKDLHDYVINFLKNNRA